MDILSMSALDIANNLLGQAYGGNAPEYAFDTPSSCSMSKWDDFDSDCHIEVIDSLDNSALSGRYKDTPISYKDEHEPSDTDNPFVYGSSDVVPPGIFGSALGAYGKVIAIMRETEVDETNYDQFFRAMWGIPTDIDLEPAVPALRSRGVAMWGGIMSNLTPTIFSGLAQAPMVKVQWHSKDRKAYGKNALVNWPRLSAIMLAIGQTLAVDDNLGRNKFKRLDYKLIRQEVPIAPILPPKALENIEVRQGWETREHYKLALGYFEQIRQLQLLLANRGFGAVVNFDDDLVLDRSALLEAAAHERPLRIGAIDLNNMGEANYDLERTYRDPPRHIALGSDPNPSDMLDAITDNFVLPYVQQLPITYELRRIELECESDRNVDRVTAEAQVKKIVTMVFPEGFVAILVRLISYVYNDKNMTTRLYVAFLKLMEARHGLYAEANRAAVSLELLQTARSRMRLFSRIAGAVGRYHFRKGIGSFVVADFSRIVFLTKDARPLIAELTRRRRNFWTGVYMKRSKDNLKPGDRVRYQLRAKLFKVSRFIVHDVGDVVIDNRTGQLQKVMHDSALRYVDKRRRKGEYIVGLPDGTTLSLSDHVQILDHFVKPKVKYESIIREYYHSIQYLLDDVKRICKKCIGGDDQVEGQELDNDTEIETDAVEPEVKPIVTQVINDVANDDDWNDAEEEMSVVKEQLYDLIEEVREEYPATSDDTITQLIQNYGRVVTAEQLKNALEWTITHGMSLNNTDADFQ